MSAQPKSDYRQWLTATHVVIYALGELDIIDRLTGNARVLKCNAATADRMLSGNVQANIDALQRAFAHKPVVQAMYSPRKLAASYPFTPGG